MRRKRQKGNALIEFALAFVLLLPLFYGTFQFGLAFFYYNQLVSAVRAGARYASLRTYDSNSTSPSQFYRMSVENMTVCGETAGCLSSTVPGLKTQHIKVQMTFANGVPAFVTVSIFNFPLNVVLRTFKLSRPAAVFPYLGVYAPAV